MKEPVSTWGDAHPTHVSKSNVALHVLHSKRRASANGEKKSKQKTHLGKGKLLAAAKERPRVPQQGLDLLHHGGDGGLRHGLGLLVAARGQELRDHAVDLGHVRVDEEGDARPAQGAARAAGRGQQGVRGRRVGVGQELRHDGRLGDDLAVVGQRGDEAARVNLEVPRVPGPVERDDDLLEGELELREGDVRAVRPCCDGVRLDLMNMLWIEGGSGG